jgi:excisionase family DNA binding protein
MRAQEASPTLIPVTEAARRLSISLRSIWKLVERGDLSVIRVTPRRVAIDEADLAAYVSSRRERSPVRRASRIVGPGASSTPDGSVES